MKTKFLSIIALTFMFFGCSSSKKIAKAHLNESENLVGLVSKEQFTATPFNDWFQPNYNYYKLNTKVVEELKPLLQKITIKAFMGTWCGDSQQQVPIFYKILDAAAFNYKNLEMIAVSNTKTTPDNAQEGYNIIRVPTFIIYKNNQEIGRIVEYPVETIEKDLLKILSNQPYKHSYAE